MESRKDRNNMSKEFHFVVRGEPVAKSRPRFNGKTGVTYTNKRTKDAEKRIREEYWYQGGKLLKDYEGRVKVALVFNFPIRKSWTKKKKTQLHGKGHIIRPDLDNLEKTVLDALNGIAWKDDSQVCDVVKMKKWANEGSTEICIKYE